MNRTQQLVCSCVLAAAGAAGCAAPVRSIDQRFIAPPEVAAVSLTREGANLLSRGQAIEAERKFRHALVLYPHAPNIKRNLAAALLETGGAAEAEAIFREVLASSGGDAAAVEAGLGRALTVQGKTAAALGVYERAYQRARERGDGASASGFALSLSTLYFNLGREDEAVCLASAAYSLRGDSAAAVRYVRLLVAVNQPGRAAAVAAKALGREKDAPSPEMLHLAALAAFGRGDFKAALDGEMRTLESGATVVAGLRNEISAVAAQAAALSGKSVEPGIDGRPYDPAGRALFLPPNLLQALEANG